MPSIGLLLATDGRGKLVTGRKAKSLRRRTWWSAIASLFGRRS
jgi:hypothetical protein